MDYRIEPMQNQHIAQVAELEKLCFPDPWSDEILQNELHNEYARWLVAVRDDTVLGYIGSQLCPPEADMMNLAVLPSFRRSGVGLALCNALLRLLREEKITSLSLEVRASNASAIALYEKLGFLQVGLRKNYYYHPQEDARILKKEWDL